MAVLALIAAGLLATGRARETVDMNCSHDPRGGDGPLVLIELVAHEETRVVTRLVEEGRLLSSAFGPRLDVEVATLAPGTAGSPDDLPVVCRETAAALDSKSRRAGTLLFAPSGDVLFALERHHLRLADKIALLDEFGVGLTEAAFDPDRDLVIGSPLPHVALMSEAGSEPASLSEFSDGQIVYFAGPCAPCAATRHAIALDALERLARDQGRALRVVFAVPLVPSATTELGIEDAETFAITDPATRLFAHSTSNLSSARVLVLDLRGSALQSVHELGSDEVAASEDEGARR